MIPLTLYNTEPVDELIWPSSNNEITLDSTALKVFTDFKKHKPRVIDASTSAVDAEKLMLKTHVRLKIIVDNNNHFIGIVSLNELNSQEVIKKISNGFSREELKVIDFMQPKEQLKAFDYLELKKARVSDVVDTLQQCGYQHCLVIDKLSHHVRGLISASDLARKLHLPLNITHNVNFLEIFNVIHH